MRLVWVWIGLVFFAVTFFSRWTFLAPFDYDYLLERYETSQWRDAFSRRIISDNELYQVAGVELWRGADIFSINPEVPPFAKYVYGASAEILGNPHWASLAWFVLALVIFYYLARHFFEQEESAWSVLFLLLSPLFFAQLTQTMLDLPQMVTLLAHILALIKLTEHRANTKLWILIAGISLGAFAATKIPILVPLILLADSWWLWKQKHLMWLLPVIILSGLTYILTFSSYFLQGNSLMDWLGAEKWTYEFYRAGRAGTYPLNVPTSLLFGWYKNWVGQPNEPWYLVQEWTVLMPLLFFGLFYKLKPDLFRSKFAHVGYLKIIFMLIFLSFLVFGFWMRYFLIILPIGILLTVRWLKNLKHPRVIFMAIAASLSVQSIMFFNPLPSETLKFLDQTWEGAYYRDMYNFLTDTKMPRLEFDAMMNNYDQQWLTQSRQVLFEHPQVSPWDTRATTQVKITYYTFDGPRYASFPLEMRRQQNRWVVAWPQEPLPNPTE